MPEQNQQFEKWGEAILVPVELIHPCPENPNVMADAEFNQLVDEIQTHGFDEPLQVVDHPSNPGQFMLVGGEHRLKAAKVLGMEKVPVVVKQTMQDELVRKTEMVRRNLVRGALNEARFGRLIEDLKNKYQNVDSAVLAQNMGFRDTKEFEKMLAKEKKAKDATVQDILDDTRKELQVVDNISYALNEIFAKYAGTLPQGYMMFAYKNRLHMIVQCEKPLYEITQKLATGLQRDNVAINQYLADVLGSAVKSAGWDELPLTDSKPYEPEAPGEGESGTTA